MRSEHAVDKKLLRQLRRADAGQSEHLRHLPRQPKEDETVFRNHYNPPSVLCPICGVEVTDLGSHLASTHPVR